MIGRRDLGKLRDRQGQARHRADQGDQNRDDGREDRPIDEAGEHRTSTVVGGARTGRATRARLACSLSGSAPSAPQRGAGGVRAGIRYGLLGCGAALVLAAGGWFAMGRPDPSVLMAALPWSDRPPETAEAEPPIAVTVTTARTQAVPISFTYTGTIIAQQDAALRPG